MNENCNICLEISGRGINEFTSSYCELIRTGKNIILESANFLVIPSFGPLNDSHVMLVPKRHTNSFAQLSDSELREGFDILSTLSAHIQKAKGTDLVFFESGAGNMTSHSGGCIVHAHIHCVTSSTRFEERLKSEISLEPIRAMDYSAACIDSGYVWYCDEKNNAYICNNPMLPSQFLRYIYAQSCGSNSAWNWRRDINIPGVMSVLETYAGLPPSRAV
jgi:diadenosine tetraphosphate (Ap4A) HIT family hydrolase